MHRRLFTVALLAVVSMDAKAEVKSVDAKEFTVSHSLTVDQSPENTYQIMVNQVHEWWNGEHSWSGDASNLYIKVELGGCFCERLPGGGAVEHLRIIYFVPNEIIKFDGALGPLQNMALQGRMNWQIKPSEAGTTISFKYMVHGHLASGFEGLAPAVDGVIGEQLQRLRSRVAAE